MKAPRFPFEPAERLARIRLGIEHPTDDAVGHVLGVHRNSVIKYRERGLSPWTADVIATDLGLHPSQIWPEWDEWVPLESHARRAS